MSASFEARRVLLDLASDKHRKIYAAVVAVTYILLLGSLALLFRTALLLEESHTVRTRAVAEHLQAEQHMREAVKDLEAAERILKDVRNRCGRAA